MAPRGIGPYPLWLQEQFASVQVVMLLVVVLLVIHAVAGAACDRMWPR